MLSVLPGAQRRWADEERVAFLCPVPGYDRHFALCERFGIEMIPVPMTDAGPDMDVVERLVAEDAAVKGIWCVPKYSNPSGVSYSDETVARLARMETAAARLPRLLGQRLRRPPPHRRARTRSPTCSARAQQAGHPDRAFVFGSTSKITSAGARRRVLRQLAGQRRVAARHNSKRTIGPDKIDQLRHVLFLRDADGVLAHMEHRAHARAQVRSGAGGCWRASSAALPGARGRSPQAATSSACRSSGRLREEVVARAGEAGVKLTPAGAPFPYGKDPEDSNIRIAPSYPPVGELEEALAVLTDCVVLAAEEASA